VFDRRNGLADVPKEPDSPGGQAEEAEADESRGRFPPRPPLIGNYKFQYPNPKQISTPKFQSLKILEVKILKVVWDYVNRLVVGIWRLGFPRNTAG
jgi:hypothetical protein